MLTLFLALVLSWLTLKLVGNISKFSYEYLGQEERIRLSIDTGSKIVLFLWVFCLLVS